MDKAIFETADPAFNRKFFLISFSIFFVIILFSTYLHHFRPDVLKVPSNTDVSTWIHEWFSLIFVSAILWEKYLPRFEKKSGGSQASAPKPGIWQDASRFRRDGDRLTSRREERSKNMWRKIWKNRLEFYPYLSIFLFWFLACFLSSLRVQNRPGIVALGVVTIPSLAMIAVAAVKTYRELP